jgi:hypothetical protein
VLGGHRPERRQARAHGAGVDQPAPACLDQQRGRPGQVPRSKQLDPGVAQRERPPERRGQGVPAQAGTRRPQQRQRRLGHKQLLPSAPPQGQPPVQGPQRLPVRKEDQLAGGTQGIAGDVGPVKPHAPGKPEGGHPADDAQAGRTRQDELRIKHGVARRIHVSRGLGGFANR